MSITEQTKTSEQQQPDELPFFAPATTDAQLEINAGKQTRWQRQFQAVIPGHVVYEMMRVRLLEMLERWDTIEGAADTDAEEFKPLRRDMAIAFSTLGEFEKAAELAVSGTDREIYQGYVEARNRPNYAWCPHPRYQTATMQPNYYISFKYWSHPANQEHVMLCCNECGYLNGIAPTADVMRVEAVRTEILELQQNSTAEAFITALQEKSYIVVKDGEVSINFSKILKI